MISSDAGEVRDDDMKQRRSDRPQAFALRLQPSAEPYFRAAPRVRFPHLYLNRSDLHIADDTSISYH